MSSVPHRQMYIDGKWTGGEENHEPYRIIDPASGDLVATVDRGTVVDADRAVAAAKAAFNLGEWRRTPVTERAAVLRRVAERIAERMDELTLLQSREIGAPVRLAGAFHIGLPIAHLQYLADQAELYDFAKTGPEIGPVPASGLIRREPLGVCAAIVPWNIPLLLAIWKVAPALAAGNSVVLKPDEKAPLTLVELVREFEAAGLPAGVLNLVTGDGEDVGARLVAHPDVRKIGFTGSTTVGKDIMRSAADSVKRVTLELGGKGPNIVLDDADLDTAVDGALFACMAYSGQACEAGTRLLLPASLHDEFVARLIVRVRTLRLGEPTDPATDLGPLVSRAQQQRVLEFIEAGRAAGATVAVGGGVPTGAAFAAGHWVEPTIFTNVTNDMRIAREEIFGPVLSVLRYETVDEAVAIANDSDYGLSAGVWSRDESRAVEVAERLEAGMVYINDWHVISQFYPFGGSKQSGLGREVGPTALDHYTEAKFVSIDRSGGLEGKAYGLVLSPAS
ncbi:aldehyde dehydrogenase family protein [Saccharopolyspora mangrovi]|uniref:Aldehyde dehydrogenase family protein n=1 Tax=Saccharopolyspora mangrovi TaxID=3082379 RepID=A0ABU6AIG8_9PSEU|nr:aldehyde dehydrogenase family protein [Saccharopolyspora sp. S2-29]MEB3371335.1 aldehyde dehydrogenase family protein [Saccharopolyspora sp. S2-29]